MKLKIGDLVRFVDEAIEGHITSFQQDNIIGVTDNSGFEIPVPVDKVTLVHGNMQRDDDDEDIAPVSSGPFVDKGIFLAVTGETKDGLAKFLIVNESSYQLLIGIAEKTGNNVKGVAAKSISPKDYAAFYTANFSSVGKWPVFIIQILRYTEDPISRTEPISKEIRIRPFDLNGSKQRSDVLNDKAWLFELDKENEDIGLDKLRNLGKFKT